MQFIIHGKNIEITPTIKNAIEKSLERIKKYKRYIKEDTIAKIDIENYPENKFKISVHIQLINHNHLQCIIENHDLYIAIKNILNPLEKQLRRLKTINDPKGNDSISEIISQNEDKANADDAVIIDISENEETEDIDN